MKHIKLIVGVNLVIILVYSVMIRFSNNYGHPPRGLELMIISARVTGLHVFANVIVGAVCMIKNEDMGKAWFLSAGIVSLVGFSACLGNAAL
jgi:hypothetical protein